MSKSVFYTLLFLLIAFSFSCNAQSTQALTMMDDIRSYQEKPIMEFKQRHIDLGKVQRGENVAFAYHFTNTGKVDLAIDFISGCDCTELDWPIKTFKPGESGKIEVVFLSSKKDKNETVEIDILLKNTDPYTQNPILEIVTYSYEF